MRKDRYIFDALYGPIQLPDFIWHIFSCPEFQRLREVRMCNINSLCLPGGANINRYEHSLGVAHLALQCMSMWPLRPSNEETRAIVLAALLHDVGTAAFGHSVQYVIGHRGFEHQSFADIVQTNAPSVQRPKFAYRQTLTEPVYFGMPGTLAAKLTGRELELIDAYVDGKGDFGKLISGSIDLDNIDNVYRLAYHIGLVRDGQMPLTIARSLSIDSGKPVVEDNAESAIWDWFHVRRKLYTFLLLNPDEFSAKCMLQEALEIAEDKLATSFRWNDVDFELLQKLSRCSDETAAIISRLTIGDLYGCLGIFITSDTSKAQALVSKGARRGIEAELSNSLRSSIGGSFKNAMLSLHLIQDVNKTERKIEIKKKSGQIIEVGRSSHRALIGVFVRNVGLSMSLLKDKLIAQNAVNIFVRGWLRDRLNCADLIEHDLYSELQDEGEQVAQS